MRAPSATDWVDVDVSHIEAVVGARALERGRVYAAQGRVLELEWGPDGSTLIGLVAGQGANYRTEAYFEDGELIEGGCSCPVGYCCKHVAALAVAVTDPGGPRAGARPRLRVVGGRDADSWEQPLRALLPDPEGAEAGDPVAIELELRETPRGALLRAGLMRPGAREGWVNRSLRWDRLSSWESSVADLRPDHLELCRELLGLQRAHSDATARYVSYGLGSGASRYLDLAAFDSPRLWSILDEAARLGLPLIHAGRGFGELAPYLRGRIELDVLAGETGVARPVLSLEGERGEGLEPLMFIGRSGHGLACAVGAEQEASNPSLPARRALRLVRLSGPTPLRLQQMLLGGEQLEIPATGMQRFRQEICPALGRVAPIISSDGSFSPPQISEPGLALRATHGKGHELTLAWEWRYRIDEEVRSVPLKRDEGLGFRDRDAERRVLTEAAVDSPELAGLGLVDQLGRPTESPALTRGVESMRLVTTVLPELADQVEVETAVDGDGGPPEYVDLSDSLEIGVSTAELEHDPDWFDLGVTITAGERELPFADVFGALAADESHLLCPDGAYISLRSERLQSLRKLIEEARALTDQPPGELRVSPYQAGLWGELVELGVVAEQAEGWQRRTQALLELEALTEHDPPEALDADLRPYQLEGFRWLASIWELGLGGILADDMGLGKTVQALALIAHARAGAAAEQGPFLVVAPTSVVSNWADEAARFAPGLEVATVSETFSKSGRDPGALAGADLVVTTYTLLRLEAQHFASLGWAGLILDEAQQVKNHQAKTHRCVRELKAPFKLALTGTPLENNLIELWSLLSITSPGLFPDPKLFSEHYARPIERGGDGERLARLRRRVRPLIKRRTKELVAADLPPKQEQVLEVDLHAKHRKLYDTYLQRERQKILGLLDDFDRNRFTILRSITLMRQLSLHPALVDERHEQVPCAKLRVLGEQLEEVIAGGHRALVFSQFTGFLGRIRKQIDELGVGYCYLDGRTRKRERVIERFRGGDDPVFLISLKAGGFGLNLTEADYCFLMDPWWNPAVEAQAVDRTHRIGQLNQVMVYRMVARDTIEEKVVTLARRKAELFSSVMDGGDEFSRGLTAADIRGLIS